MKAAWVFIPLALLVGRVPWISRPTIDVPHCAIACHDYTTAITGEVLYVDAGFPIGGMVFH